MKEIYLEKFYKAYEVLDKIEDEISSTKDILEKKLEKIQDRIFNYELKLELTEKQEQILNDIQLEADELEEEIDKITEFLEHIDEALDLIDFDTNLTNKRIVKLRKQVERYKK